MPYATIAELLASYPAGTRPNVTDNQDLIDELTTLLTDVSDMVTDEVSFDFYRHPEDSYDPDEVRLFSARGKHRLHVHEGIVELTSVEIRSGPTDDWELVDEDDYVLVAMYGRQGRPYDHLDHLTRHFPTGPETIRLTGVFGFEEVPSRVKRATIAWARQGVTGSDSYSGGQVGPDQFGRIVAPDRMPEVTFRLLERERQRYLGCGT